MARFVDRLPLPSKVPLMMVCHWLMGSDTLVLCINIHTPPGVPLVAEKETPFKPFTTMPVILGVVGTNGGFGEDAINEFLRVLARVNIVVIVIRQIVLNGECFAGATFIR